MADQAPVVVGTASKKRFKTPPKKVLLILSLILLGIIILAAAYFVVKKPAVLGVNTAFTIKGQSYSKEDIKKLITYPTSQGVTAEKASTQAFDAYKVIQAGQDLGITVTDEDIEAAKDNLVPASQSQDLRSDPWIILLAKSAAITNKVNPANSANSKGYSYIFRFGDKIEKGPDYTPPGYNDAALIAQDRAYAQARANYYHQQLKDGKITPDEALNEIKQDARLGYGKPNTNRSVHFGTTEQKDWRQEVLFEDVINYVKTNPNGLTDIQVGKTTATAGGKDAKETFLYFLLMESSDRAQPVDPDAFNQALYSIDAQYHGL